MDCRNGNLINANASKWRRLFFFTFPLNADLAGPLKLRNILWTDKYKFYNDGITNYHNAVYIFGLQKIIEVPYNGKTYEKRPKGSLGWISLNIWQGIVDNNLIDPYFCQNIWQVMKKNLVYDVSSVPNVEELRQQKKIMQRHFIKCCGEKWVEKNNVYLCSK